jgi:protein SCO1/2
MSWSARWPAPLGAIGIAALVACLAIASGCGRDDAAPYPGVGVVEEVKPEFGQVVIAHQEIEGLMEAMTMNFAVPDAELLARLSPGQKIEFEVLFTGRSYDVVSAKVVGEVEVGDGWARLGRTLVRADPAPAFSLIDQAGNPLALADLAGSALLVDFIYTQCPGPCPILTSTHIAAQRQLDPSVREGSRFLSITLDPAYDSPEILAAHAKQRGVDLDHWSFLTGPPEEVARVVRSFGVGSTRNAQGEIDHLVVSYLIDQRGQIVKRYVGQAHEPDEIAGDLADLVRGE